MLRAFLIDPNDRSISELYIHDGLEGLQFALGMDRRFSGYVECVRLGQRADLWIDEEGALTEGRPVWTFAGNAFAGAALILYNDGEGNGASVPDNITLRIIAAGVEWTKLETTGDFGPAREYVTNHPILGPNTPVYEGGKPIYRDGAGT